MTYLRAGEGMRNASFQLDVKNYATASWKLALRNTVARHFQSAPHLLAIHITTDILKNNEYDLPSCK